MDMVFFGSLGEQCIFQTARTSIICYIVINVPIIQVPVLSNF